VRALSSREQPADRWPSGVRAFAVDLNDGASLRAALEGADGTFMLSGYDDAGIVASLTAAGVRRVALLSSGSVPTAHEDNAVAAYHRASEAALRDAGLEATFLQPNTFATNALRWVDAIRAGQPVVAPFATVPIAVNDPRDIARVARTALTEDGHGGRSYRITGPEALLPERQVAILADVLGRPIAFKAQSDADARAEMEASMPQPYVDACFEFFVEGTLDETTVRTTVRDVTGGEPRTFRAWAAEHAPAFG
jgi:uncharacterized protein YbjT (DUF2867 family)